MNNANRDIRAEIREAGVTLWKIAHKIGISEATMTRKMRFELNDNEKKQIRDAVNSIVREEET